ncbi:MAG: hypothetical protein LBO20_06850, partial [Bifidobacteriaceae bacterium]|nr:hypothetical protein [Bifidobacteriaceae bacterium]
RSDAALSGAQPDSADDAADTAGPARRRRHRPFQPAIAPMDDAVGLGDGIDRRFRGCPAGRSPIRGSRRRGRPAPV